MASLLDCSPAVDFLAVQTCAVFVCITPELLRPAISALSQSGNNARGWCGQRRGRLHRPSTATAPCKHAVTIARSASTHRQKLCAAHKARALVLSAVGGFAVRAEQFRSDVDLRSTTQDKKNKSARIVYLLSFISYRLSLIHYLFRNPRAHNPTVSPFISWLST